MKILIVMSGFFPGKKYGGPPVSVDNFCSLMKGECECFIITHNHDMGELVVYPDITEGWNDRNNAKVLYLSNEDYCYSGFFEIAKDLNPDYIYLQGLFQQCTFPCLKLAKKLGIKVLLAPRGELCGGAFKKKYKKIPYIAALRMMGLLNNVSFQSTSDEETKAISLYLGVSRNRIHLLTNIPSIPKKLPKREIKQKGNARFVFISRVVRKKNLLSAINYLKDIQGKAVFDIYGPKEDGIYWQECEESIMQLPPNITVNYKGILAHEDIHQTFCQYDAFLFPTFSENYGHVIAEALLTGCIPIISDQTPWTDMNDFDAGWAVSLDNQDGFITAIQKVVDLDDVQISQKRANINEYLCRKLKLDELRSKYLTVFK